MNVRRTKKPSVTLCVPTLNEEGNIDRLYARFCTIRQTLENEVKLQLQFTDNASSDFTWEKIVSIVNVDNDVRAFRFGRNIGFQESILFNFLHAEGDAVIQLDADLQDPIDLVEVFIREWKSGAKVVSGERIKRKENIFLTGLRRTGYWIISKFSEHPVPENVGDFRLLDKQVISYLRSLKSPSPYLRAVISSYGFPEVRIPYSRENRKVGKSKFSFSALIGLGSRGLLDHSKFFIKLYNLFSMVILMILFGFLVWVITQVLQGSNIPPGYLTLFAAISILSLFVTLGISVLAYYLFRIHRILSNDNDFYFESIP